MRTESLTDAKRRLVTLMKREGRSTVASLARSLGLTDVAVRQHLLALETAGLVHQTTKPARGRGRPAKQWSLSDLADDFFPDRHGELTVDLIETVRRVLGEEALATVIADRADKQTAQYKTIVQEGGSLESRLEALAHQRSIEGYMAEVVAEDSGCFLLIEHHCPICEAATNCTGLCSAELEVFRSVLEDAEVERTSHLLSGEDRCIYRIRPHRGTSESRPT